IVWNGLNNAGLAWSSNGNIVGTQYILQQSLSAGGGYSTVATVTNTGAVVSSLTSNTTYYFQVIAQTASGTSAASSTATLTTIFANATFSNSGSACQVMGQTTFTSTNTNSGGS